jgi:hypothetical protein
MENNTKLKPLDLLFALILVFFLALGFSGCATSQLVKDMNADPTLQFLDALSKVTAADLDAANADAAAHGDVEATTCYPVLKKYLGVFASDSATPIKGAFSANQKKRDLLKSSKGGVPSELKIACAAFVQDERDFLIRLGVIAGAIGGTGGAASPFLGMIP